MTTAGDQSGPSATGHQTRTPASDGAAATRTPSMPGAVAPYDLAYRSLTASNATLQNASE